MTISRHLLLAAFLLAGLSLAAVHTAAQVVNIPDPGLNAAIRQSLHTPTGDITVADMESLIVLDASRAVRGQSAPMIESLEGLQTAKNLGSLDLSGATEDVDGWYGKRNLLTSDLSFLSGLTRLQTLDLDGNALTNLTLPENLTGLRAIHLGGNRMANVAFLSGVTNLRELFLHDNQLTSLTLPESLTSIQLLGLAGNRLTDFSFLSGLTGLQNLWLAGNQLTNLTLPPHLTNLQTLALGGNRLTSFTLQETLTSLRELYLESNTLTNLTLPQELRSLISLRLHDNLLNDVCFLSRLTNLTRLHVEWNQLTSLTLPEALTTLTELNVMGNPLVYVAVPAWMDLDALNITGFPKERIIFHAGSVRIQGGALQWKQGILQFAPTANGSWMNLPVASPMPLSPVGQRGFFRVEIER